MLAYLFGNHATVVEKQRRTPGNNTMARNHILFTSIGLALAVVVAEDLSISFEATFRRSQVVNFPQFK